MQHQIKKASQDGNGSAGGASKPTITSPRWQNDNLIESYYPSSTIWTSPRTPKCMNYEDEQIKLKQTSNFISHPARVCKQIPPDHSFDSWSEQHKRGQGTLSTDPVTTSSGSGYVAQHQFLTAYIQKGIENPVKQVLCQGWCEHFVKGLIKDDLPFALGEGAGMKKMFIYLLPKGYMIPSHQTVQCDLNKLSVKMNDIINKTLQVCDTSFDESLKTIDELTDEHRTILHRLRFQVIFGQAKTPYMLSLALLSSGSMMLGNSVNAQSSYSL